MTKNYRIKNNFILYKFLKVTTYADPVYLNQILLFASIVKKFTILQTKTHSKLIVL